MTPASTNLLASIPKIDYWLPQADGFDTVVMDKDDGRKFITTVSNSDVAALHPLLPQAILAIAAHPDKAGRKEIISGHLVSYTLELLRGKQITFTDSQQKLRVFIKPTTLFSVPTDKTQVNLRGTYVDVRTVNVGERDVQIAVHGYLSHANISKALLEENFPGWEKRWLMALDLGFANNECLPHVFFQPAQQNAVPFVTFDWE